MGDSAIKVVNALLVLILLTQKGNSFEDNDIYGIAYVHQTVDDLTKAVRFYTEVLDGMLIPEFRIRGLQGDSHYYQMFQKEILDARNRGTSPENMGVPDIRNGGRNRVNWDFVLFDNALLWLIQFTDNSGNVFRRFDTAVGSAKNGYGHMALWLDANLVNPYQMMQEIFEGERNINSAFAGFSAAEDVTSSTQRNNLFRTNVDKFLTPESGGFRLAATRGTVGEKVELSVRRGIGNNDTFQDFCSVKAVHSSMLEPSKNQAITNKYKKPLVKTSGIIHVEITVPDSRRAIEFYTSMIGGKSPQTSVGLQFPGFFRNMILQDDIIGAQEYNRNLDANFGFVDILLGNPNSGSLDISFINFDNMYLELYKFNPRNPSDANRLQRSWSSPAYLNVMSPGFWVKENVAMSSYIRNFENRAAGRGWTSAKANRAVNVNRLGDNVQDQDFSRAMTQGGLNGFQYTFAKGPSGEQFSLAKFTGTARDVLQRSMKEYGAVSTAFAETNPYTWGGFNEACGRMIPPPAPGPAPGPPPGAAPNPSGSGPTTRRAGNFIPNGGRTTRTPFNNRG